MSTFDSRLECVYRPQLELGVGMHSLGRTAAYLPFRPESLILPTNAHVQRRSGLQVAILADQKDVDRTCSAELEGRLPVPGLPVSSTFSNLRNFKISEHEIATLADFTIDFAPLLVPENGPKFSEEAEALLHEDPREFAQRYGSFFVAGYSSRTKLTILTTHRADDQEDLIRFKAALQEALDEASLTSDDSGQDSELVRYLHQVGTAFAAAGEKTRGLRVDTTIQLKYLGLNLPSPAFNDLRSFLSLTAITMENIDPVPFIAHVRPFKTIDEGCLMPQDFVNSAAQKKLTKGFTDIYALENAIRGRKYPEVNTHLPSLAQLEDELSTFDDASQDEVDSWLARLEAEKKEVQTKLARRDFVDLLREGYPSERWPYQPGHRFDSRAAAGFEAHCAGLRPDYLPPIQDRPEMHFIKDEIVTQTERLRYENKIIPSYPHKRLPTDGGWVIGWMLVNDRTDGYSGEAYVKQADRDAVDIEFHPNSFRDSNWTLHVYTLDRSLYFVD